VENQLVYSATEFPNSLNPILPLNKEARDLVECIFDGLTNITLENNREYQFGLAKHIEQDRTRKNIYIVTPRSGVEWHDGHPFSADDVLFTYRCILNTSNQSPLRARLRSYVSSIDEISEYKIQFTFTAPLPYYLVEQLLSFKIIPHSFRGRILSSNLYTQRGREFSRMPIGTGPYKVTESRQGEKIVLAANANNPKLPKVTLRQIMDYDKSILRLKRGEINLMLDVKPDYFSDLTKKELAHQQYTPYYFYAIAFNMRGSVFGDREVRKACVYVCDKKRLVKKIWNHENATDFINSGPFPHNYQFQYPELTPYNQHGARSLLARSSSSALKFSLLIPSGDKTSQKIAEEYQRIMSEVGAKVNIVPRGIGSFRRATKQGDFDAALVVYHFDHLYNITPLFYSNSPENITGIQNLDTLLAAWENEILKDEKENYGRQIHQRVHQEAPYTFLFTVPKRAYYYQSLKGISIHPEEVFASIENWSYHKVK